MKHFTWTILLMTSSISLAADKPAYPPSKMEPVVDKLHGVEVADPYRWLEDGKSAEVKEWTEKQNAFTKAYLDRPAGPRRDPQAARHAARDRQPSARRRRARAATSTPSAKASRTSRSSTSATACSGKDRVLVDPNALSKDGTDRPRLVVSQPRRQAAGLRPVEGRQRASRCCTSATSPPARTCPTSSTARAPARSPGCRTARASTTRATPPPAACPRARRTTTATSSSTSSAAIPAKDPKVFGEGRRAGGLADGQPVARWPLAGRHRAARAGRSRRSTSRTVASPTAASCRWSRRSTPSSTSSLRNDRFYVRTNEKAPRYQLFRVDPLKPARERLGRDHPGSARTCSKAWRPSATTWWPTYMHEAASRLQHPDARRQAGWHRASRCRRSAPWPAWAASGTATSCSTASSRSPCRRRIYRVDLKAKAADERLGAGPGRHRLRRVRGRAGDVSRRRTARRSRCSWPTRRA